MGELKSVKLPKAYLKKVRDNKKATGLPIGVFICHAIDKKLSIKQSDIDHLMFIYQRLLNKHNEKENIDYMVKFLKIIRML
jgi:hypothetical protein